MHISTICRLKQHHDCALGRSEHRKCECECHRIENGDFSLKELGYDLWLSAGVTRALPPDEIVRLAISYWYTCTDYHQDRVASIDVTIDEIIDALIKVYHSDSWNEDSYGDLERLDARMAGN